MTAGPVSLPLSGSNLYGALFWLPYLAWLTSETLVLSRRRAAKVAAATHDRGSVRLLRLCILLAVVSAFSSANLARATAFGRVRPDLFFAGIALMVAGLALRWWAVRTLGRFFTIDVAIHAAHTVIQTGPYRWIRHPAYAGSLLTLFGIGLALGTWLGLAAIALFAAVGFGNRISVEEATLMVALGEPYRAYARRTRRVIPFAI